MQYLSVGWIRSSTGCGVDGEPQKPDGYLSPAEEPRLSTERLIDSIDWRIFEFDGFDSSKLDVEVDIQVV